MADPPPVTPNARKRKASADDDASPGAGKTPKSAAKDSMSTSAPQTHIEPKPEAKADADIILAYRKTYNESWFDNNFDVDAEDLVEPTHITSGSEWESAMADARNKSPPGLYFLDIKRSRDNEGVTMSYLRFGNVVHFRQWVAKKGKFIFWSLPRASPKPGFLGPL